MELLYIYNLIFVMKFCTQYQKKIIIIILRTKIYKVIDTQINTLWKKLSGLGSVKIINNNKYGG